MHLGPIDGPFVPHNLISTQESTVPLLKFQMAPRLQILMASGSKKRTQNMNINMEFLILLKHILHLLDKYVCM